MIVFRFSPEYKNCDIIIIPKRLAIEHLSFGFQKNSPYLQLFNYYIKRMQESGIVDQIFAKYELHEQECPSPSLSLGFENCISAFFLIIGGLILSIILLIVEHHPESWRRLALILNYYGRSEIHHDQFH